MPRQLVVGRALTGIGGADPSHRAVHLADGIITWTGADPRHAPEHDELVDVGEAWLTPGFVDAHVHATATGLQLVQLDLSRATSRRDVLVKLARHVADTHADVVMGTGWDDSTWPISGPPTADELSAAAPGRHVALIRADGHSSVVDRSTLQALDLDGCDPAHIVIDGAGRRTGWLKEGASARAISWVRARLPDGVLATARTAMADAARALGITTVHEMGIPALSDLADAELWRTGSWPIHVEVWWADIDIDPSGPLRPGGDLFLDGSIGSCTAATQDPYLTGDHDHTTGALLHDDDVVVDFLARATRAGVGAGFHAIGDAAIEQAVGALQHVAASEGISAVRAARHRLEHVELVTPSQIAAMADLGVVASVQPAFDAVWNGPDGLYEHRFGRQRADRTNPLRDLAEAGVPMCFSSDSPVTPMDPWGAILAAEAHHGGRSVTRAQALHAATIGGHEVIRQEGEVGALTAGRRGDLVAWPGDPLTEDPTGWQPVLTLTG